MRDVPTNSDPIDRLAPGRRPARRAVMHQKWRSLLFLHWRLPPEEVRRLLPRGLELDLYEGDAYVGLVPFTMHGVRPVGLPALPWLSRFHETNLRTYVHRDGRNPGVYFFSLEAANPVAVALARSLFHLPYHRARMSLDALDDPEAPGSLIHYASERLWPGPVPAKTAVDCRVPRNSPAPATVGTRDHFLIERYLLYTAVGERLLVGQVRHDPYPVQSAQLLSVEESLFEASGLKRPDQIPLAHFSWGVDVKIFSFLPCLGFSH